MRLQDILIAFLVLDWVAGACFLFAPRLLGKEKQSQFAAFAGATGVIPPVLSDFVLAAMDTLLQVSVLWNEVALHYYLRQAGTVCASLLQEGNSEAGLTATCGSLQHAQTTIPRPAFRRPDKEHHV